MVNELLLLMTCLSCAGPTSSPNMQEIDVISGSSAESVNKVAWIPDRNATDSDTIHLYDYLDELFPPQGPGNLSYTVTEEVVLGDGIVDPNEFNTECYQIARSDLEESGELAEGHAFGCGPIGMFTLLNYLAETTDRYVYRWQDPSLQAESQAEMIKDIHRSTFKLSGTSTSTSFLSVTRALRGLMQDYGLGAKYELLTSSMFSLGSSEETAEYFKDIIDSGNPFMILHPVGNKYYPDHYVTCYGYQEIAVKRLWDTKTKTMFLVNLNWGKTSPDYVTYYDIDWLDDGLFNTYWAISPLDIESRYRVHELTAADMPFGTGYPSEETQCSVPLPDSVYGEPATITRLRTQNYEDECIVLSPRRENAGEAFFELKLPFSSPRIEIDLSFWRSLGDEYISSLTYSLDLSVVDTIYGTHVGWIDFSQDLDRMSQDRAAPFMFVTNRDSFGFRLERSDLPLGDSNKGRVAISEIRVWEYV